jgi:hypothetical protein
LSVRLLFASAYHRRARTSRHVVELGSGCGLAGIVASRYAASVRRIAHPCSTRWLRPARKKASFMARGRQFSPIWMSRFCKTFDRMSSTIAPGPTLRSAPSLHPCLPPLPPSVRPLLAGAGLDFATPRIRLGRLASELADPVGFRSVGEAQSSTCTVATLDWEEACRQATAGNGLPPYQCETVAQSPQHVLAGIRCCVPVATHGDPYGLYRLSEQTLCMSSRMPVGCPRYSCAAAPRCSFLCYVGRLLSPMTGQLAPVRISSLVR